MSDLYIYGGGTISVGVSSDEVKEALIDGVNDGSINLGKTVGSTLSCTLSQDLKTMIDNGYSQLKSAWLSSPSYSIPFFINTDQHEGAYNALEATKYINNIDVDGMEIVNFNLGDTCANGYSPNGYLAHLFSCVEYCKNIVQVPGNHDCGGSSGTPYKFGEASKFWLTNLPYRQAKTKALCKDVYDHHHNVKLVCVDPYREGTTMYGAYFSTEVVNWLINTLSEDDGFDIICVCHENSFTNYTKRNGSTGTVENNCSILHNLLAARKAKTSGTITDSQGVSHSYNFTGCTTKMLCKLAGHLHDEKYSTTDFTEYAANAWVTNGLVFGLVDRANNVLKIWNMNTSTKTVDTLLTLSL